MGTDVEVLAVDGPICDVLQQARAEADVVLLADGPIDRSPPDLVDAAGLLDQELVLRRAAGVLTGAYDERAVGGDDALAVADGMLVELGGRKVAIRRLDARGGVAKLGGRHGLLLTSDLGALLGRGGRLCEQTGRASTEGLP